MNGIIRKSNFELLRIFAMSCILYYHLIIYYILPLNAYSYIIYSLQLPLHVGVLLFIFISGYFGIKPTLRGWSKLLLMAMIYYIPLQLVYDITHHAGFGTIIRDLLVISRGPYWFIKIYLLFYLFVPIVNKFLINLDIKHRFYMLLFLAIINIWFGCLTRCDISLIDGKSIVNFTLLYVIGDTIRIFEYNLQKWNTITLLAIFICFNMFIMLSSYIFLEVL
ncbi:hypothetical protein [Xylanibacter muris]|uniref:hypothetical protein n=1 Tax=Xylanibacter muris TaxID=2736290 RepID=UPI002557F85F|nr:hypothetical protein [Xylanibacter muris]